MSGRNTFYKYLALHSLLIGIFPFYIPVYLWQQGFDLGDICFFISLAGLGFCVSLAVWDRLRRVIRLTSLVGVSLGLEIALVGSAYTLDNSWPGLLLAGFIYGTYNCFYWTTLRALFFDLTDIHSTGRKYGNFQIFAGVSLQLGIVTGGVLLEKSGFITIVVASSVIALAGFFIITHNKPEYPHSLSQTDSLTTGKVIRFTDPYHSKLIFIIDGFFLFAESFFWVLTLFFIAHQSFATLGTLILLLAVIFGILFYLLKNTIDRLGRKRVYFLAVILYAASWALRAVTTDDLALHLLYVLLVVVAFCTAFFRLAMNKRFYDLARFTLAHDYLILKSYYTQIVVAVLFALLGLYSSWFESDASLLVVIYSGAAALSLIYLLYGWQRQTTGKTVPL